MDIVNSPSTPQSGFAPYFASPGIAEAGSPVPLLQLRSYPSEHHVQPKISRHLSTNTLTWPSGNRSRSILLSYLSYERIRSFLYHSSFYIFILIIAVLLVGSAWGLGEQAWRTRDHRRWNIVILVAAYIAIVGVFLLH